MSRIVDLNGYRRARRRRELARDVASWSVAAALFAPGAITTFVLLCLQRFGVVDWSRVWLFLPLLIDAALWLAVVRSVIINGLMQEDDDSS